jgi:hypothetical protein
MLRILYTFVSLLELQYWYSSTVKTTVHWDALCRGKHGTGIERFLKDTTSDETTRLSFPGPLPPPGDLCAQ